MEREWAQNKMRSPFSIECGLQMDMESRDRATHCTHRFLRIILAPPHVPPLEGNDLFEFAQCLGLHRFQFVGVIENGFEFLLFAPQASQRFQIFKTQTALLNS
jgi:hypothetical protein